jgi:hypothetical protein
VIVDVRQVTTPLRQYYELRWSDAYALNKLMADQEPELEARYWNNAVGYFEMTPELLATVERLPVRVVEHVQLPQLEDDQWRKFNHVLS